MIIVIIIIIINLLLFFIFIIFFFLTENIEKGNIDPHCNRFDLHFIWVESAILATTEIIR